MINWPTAFVVAVAFLSCWGIAGAIASLNQYPYLTDGTDVPIRRAIAACFDNALLQGNLARDGAVRLRLPEGCVQ